MSETIAAAAATVSRKRSRSKAKSAAKKNTVVILNDRFLCSYSGQLVQRAIFIPGIPTVAFANIPCALAWLDENVADTDERNKYTEMLADEYEQTTQQFLRAPDRKYLTTFGGDRTYAEWIGDLRFWDVQADASGVTVADYQRGLKRRGSKNPRSKSEASNKIVLERGACVIMHKGIGAAAVKRVVGVDGAAADTTEGPRKKGAMTPASAYSKLQTFANTNKELSWKRAVLVTENGIFTANTPVEELLGDPEVARLRNPHGCKIFSGTVCGPVFCVVQKKFSVTP